MFDSLLLPDGEKLKRGSCLKRTNVYSHEGKACMQKVLSVSSSETRTCRDHFFHFFLSPNFHELWHSVMSICLFTEVKRQWATSVLGWVTASVHYSCLFCRLSGSC